jgi:hypothetical protein
MSPRPINESVPIGAVAHTGQTTLQRLNGWISSREAALAVLGICLFFLLNLSIASRSPFGGWMDETGYVDPGLNLAAGKGWTSSMNSFQTDREFCACSPLYPAALSVWVRVFGISMVASRAYCYFLGAVGTYFFWLAAFRFKFLASPARLFWIVLLSTEYSTNWMMRNQRYDVWIFVGLGVALLGASLRHPAGRYGLIFLGCFLGPTAGFVCVPYIVTMAAFLTVVTGFSRWKEALMAMAGAGCGMIAVFAFLILNHQLGTFLHAVKSLSAVGVKLSFSTVLQIFLYPSQDYGVILMMVALLLLTMVWKRNTAAIYRRWLLLGWGTVVLVPCIMMARTSFGMMYFYMVIIPLSLSVLALLTLQFPAHGRRLIIPAAAAALLGLACLTGLPGRIYTSLREWSFRDPRQIQDFVAAHTGPDDCVLADYKFYFALRDRVRRCVNEFYIQAIPPDEAAQINVVLLPATDFPDLTRDASKLQSIGGGWKKVAVFPTEEMRAKLHGRSLSTPTYILYRR